MLYFLHPTLVPPSNTAIVKGYNALAGTRVKLGRWDEYLAMRRGILELNAQYRALLSNDLGAIAGFLFDLGAERYTLPPRDPDPDTWARWQRDLAAVRELSAQEARAQSLAREGDLTRAG